MMKEDLKKMALEEAKKSEFYCKERCDCLKGMKTDYFQMILRNNDQCTQRKQKKKRHRQTETTGSNKRKSE